MNLKNTVKIKRKYIYILFLLLFILNILLKEIKIMNKSFEVRLVEAMSKFSHKKTLPPNEKVFISHIYNKVIKSKEQITVEQKDNALSLIKKWMEKYSDFKKN